MNFVKRNAALILGLSIPVVMVLAIAVTIYVPGLFVHPQHNFVYVVGDSESYCQRYSVTGNSIILASTTADQTNRCGYLNTTPHVYIYDVIAEKSNEITPETATTLSVDSSQTSQDGYEIHPATNGGDPLFALMWSRSSDYGSYYIVGHGYSKKINTVSDTPRYYGSQFRFLGWIK